MKYHFIETLIVTINTLLIVGQTSAVTSTIGVDGINSAGLGLTGAGIAIGQVEVGRPGKRVADGGPDSLAMANTFVVPIEVFRQVGQANTADTMLHSEQVAGVMISTDTSDGSGMFANGVAPTGVAPGAALYASATNVPVLPGQPEAAISAQHIAMQNAGDVRAINFSFGEQLTSGQQLDGNSLLTQFVDWSAHVDDVLYVIAGNEGGGGIPAPTDNYNGLTIAYTTTVSGVYRQYYSTNVDTEDAVGPRTSVDLLAPGRDVELEGFGNVHTSDNGTSFAAPLVTGTVALLQQFAETKISTPHWDADARRHEVMKAVLVNSADKIKDDGAIAPVGSFLGMEKTIVDSDGTSTWLDSNAFKDVGGGDTEGEVPLDLHLGAGQLNANRAKIQFAPGKYGPNGASVPAIGWDYHSTAGDDSTNKYALANPISGGTYISLTLAWDKIV